MGDTVVLSKANQAPDVLPAKMPDAVLSSAPTIATPALPSYTSLQTGLQEANRLVDDIVLKKYLHKLTDLEIIPLDESLKKISDIRLFRITEMVYQNNEYSTYKFASVFNAVQNLNCGIFIIADSNGKKTDFYMGVRSLDNLRTTKSLKDTLRNALSGQFPGVKTQDLLDPVAEDFLSNIPSKNIVSVSCVAQNKDEEFNSNDMFIQGLEKFALAMQGQIYTTIILAKSVPVDQLDATRNAYESIYTQLSPFTNMQLSYGSNMAMTISDAFSHGTSIGTSDSTNFSTQKGTSNSKSTATNESTSKANTLGALGKSLGTAAVGIASILTAPLTRGTSLVVAGGLAAAQMGVNAYNPKTTTKGTTTTKGEQTNESQSYGEAYTESENTTDTETRTNAETSGSTQNMQLTSQNKSLLNTLERIDLQLKRIDECESVGMWECGAYFLSDSQETAEMAAGTYRALMKGEKSGVETSSVNFWGRQSEEKLPLLREYITNFVHPVFEYSSDSIGIEVTPSSLVSSNELAIQMGLPRKSVCGFPVIEHADFGKEVVKYQSQLRGRNIPLGHVFSMGQEMETEVHLDCESLTMHTFVTGSTGSGKSNAVYEMLYQLRTQFDIPFLVVEPAKGEYKHIFGQYPDVHVYGTNHKKSELLRINPFAFPSDIHVLEHLDRLVELFNVCWPMYAAMPAILKEAMENAYVDVGWDLGNSENLRGDKFPNVKDLLAQIEKVIDKSQYSSENKGNYTGALVTRVRSLTTGLNGLIFSDDALSDQDLFDHSVIVDLSRVGSSETKSFIMGLLVIKLSEYRMSSGRMNSPLQHITVLEEAHNLLKRTSQEQSVDGANLVGKSVELLANSIAEMRTYGEGFIISDQSPSLLDMSVIRNTNTKIILRLPDKTDRELTGYAAGLNTSQIDELAKLGRGIAAIYQNDWIEPVLLKVSKCKVSEKSYEYTGLQNIYSLSSVKNQLVNFLIYGRLSAPIPFALQEIEAGLHSLGLSSHNVEFVEEQIAEYRKNGSLLLWSDTNFRKLAKYISDILEIRVEVEQCIVNAPDNQVLSNELCAIARRHANYLSDSGIAVLTQCFMKNMSCQSEDGELRLKLYKQWIYYVREGKDMI